MRRASAIMKRAGDPVSGILLSARSTASHNSTSFDLALDLWKAKQPNAARAILVEICAESAGDARVINLLGVLDFEAGDEASARSHFLAAIALNGAYAAPCNNLGNIELSHHDLPRARSWYEMALACNPDYIEALVNLATVSNLQGQYQTAEQLCRRAAELDSRYAGTYCNLGNALLGLGKAGEAIAAYREALRLEPGLPEALANLALATEDASYLAGTLDYFEAQVRRQPNNHVPLVRIAQALQALHRWDEALDKLKQAELINPTVPDLLLLLGINHAFAGSTRLGSDYLRKVLAIGPSPVAASGIAFDAMYASDQTGDSLCELYRRWGQRYAIRPQLPLNPAIGLENDRRLRIGYLSRDFGRHSVAFFLEPILATHDHERFEIYCYSTLIRPDDVTERLTGMADVWRDVSTYSEKALTDAIWNDAIDILIDLSGHTSGNRLGVFASKPAPLQVSYLGHPCTTGVATIDFRIGDDATDPPRMTESHYVEHLWRLPECFLTYRPQDAAPEVVPSPLLSRGFTTFGSFNNVSKVTDEVISLWAEILRLTPESRLVIKSFNFSSERARKRVQDAFLGHGIDASRLDVFDWRPDVRNHLELYGEIDIALDPFPYNGTTTTCEALWMGVPVVCLAGERHSARVGVSLLKAIGLDSELLATSKENYLALAVSMATDRSRLESLRLTLRQRMSNSELLNHVGFTRRLESAYREMWRGYCAAHGSNKENKIPESVTTHGRIGVNGIFLPYDGGVICVPDSLQNVTRYVIEEQRDWFEYEIQFIRRLLKPGDTAIDIGANHGVYALTMARAVQASGCVLAIEPEPQTALRLRESIAENSLHQVRLIEAAVAREEGERSFRIAPAGSEYGRLVTSSDDDHHDHCITVPTVTLNGLTTSEMLSNVAFIKIDAEGMDSNIIAGGDEFFCRYGPLVMAEFLDGGRPNIDLFNEFEKVGYSAYRMVPSLMVLIPFDGSDKDIPAPLNVFFCNPDRAAELENRGLLITKHDGFMHTNCSVGASTLFLESKKAESLSRRAMLLHCAATLALRELHAVPNNDNRVILATILSEYGARIEAVQQFMQCLEECPDRDSLYCSPDFWPSIQPPVGVSERKPPPTTTAAIAAWIVLNGYYSSMFDPGNSLRMLNLLRVENYYYDEALRRISLMTRLRGEQIE